MNEHSTNAPAPALDPSYIPGVLRGLGGLLVLAQDEINRDGGQMIPNETLSALGLVLRMIGDEAEKGIGELYKK